MMDAVAPRVVVERRGRRTMDAARHSSKTGILGRELRGGAARAADKPPECPRAYVSWSLSWGSWGSEYLLMCLRIWSLQTRGCCRFIQ